MAEEKGLSLDNVQGSGPNNRIIAADVAEAKVGAPAATQASAPKAAAASAPASLPSTSAAYEDFENS